MKRFCGSVGATVAVCALALGTTNAAAQEAGVNRFEKNVAAYEAADRTSPPPANAILLVGDSQFYRWKTLAEDLPGYTIVNRGIDSFTMTDVLFFVNRLVLPYKPRMIVVHAGGNDVNTGRTPQQVLGDFQALVRAVRVSMPNVPIVFSSVTPGPGRWSQAAVRAETNRLIREYIQSQPGLVFLDLWTPMLTPDGQPREDLWVEDRIHPNHPGYQLRAKLMRPILGAPDRR
jgi:lysophospholipase L1-like esterase